MTKIVQKSLPNAISFEDVGDAVVRQKIMLLKENVASLAEQLATAQRAIVELQSMQGGGNDGPDADEILAQAAEDAADKVAAHAADVNIHVTSELQALWNGKYGLPADGIPKSDLSEEVQALLDGGSSTEVAAHASTHASDGTDPITPASIGAAPEGLVAVQTFTATTTANVQNNAAQTVTVSVAKLGYTPVLIGDVRLYGQKGSYNYYRWACAAFACTAASLSGNTATLTIDKNSGDGAVMKVAVEFSVIYLKASATGT